MKQTRFEYITEQQSELEAEGLSQIDIKELNFDNEYYELVENHIKQKGQTITNEVYNSLTQGQQYHFNKCYNSRCDKVTNSDYSQAVEVAEQKSKNDFNKYLEEQAGRQQELEIIKQKENKLNIRHLNDEIEQLSNNLFNYENLSPKGKMNIKRIDHEQKQNEILQKITELKEQIKSLH